MNLLRIYEPVDAGPDGYPGAWHQCPDCRPGDSGCRTCGDAGSIKALIRSTATADYPADDIGGTGYRCERCLHPWHPGHLRPHGPMYSPCDEHCRHAGPGVAVMKTGERIHDVDPIPGLGYEAAWRVLTTHHLNGNKLDCRWWNLAALCQRCHLTIQGKVVMERRWLTEHTEWFKPHAAGWYAFDRLGQDLTRAETMFRLDELLALEDRQLGLEAA